MKETPTYTIRLTNGQEYGPAPMDMVQRWAREGRIPADASLAPSDGSALRGVLTEPSLAEILSSPTAPPTAAPGQVEPVDDAMATIIPFRNPQALVGYYVSVASLIPFFAFVLGPAAIVLGILGFRRYRREPRSKGVVHAWVAIILGSLTALLHYGVVVGLIIMGIIEAS